MIACPTSAFLIIAGRLLNQLFERLTCQPNLAKPEGLDKRRLVRPVGLEPTTHGFEVRHSIQLSYGRVIFIGNILTRILPIYQ